jgi:hypothetical protein
LRGSFISKEDFPAFNTFEADILFINPYNNVQIISSGYQSIFNVGCLREECTVEKVLGEYDENFVLKPKKFIQVSKLGKVVIKLNSNTCRSKYEQDIKTGWFMSRSFYTE